MAKNIGCVTDMPNISENYVGSCFRGYSTKSLVKDILLSVFFQTTFEFSRCNLLAIQLSSFTLILLQKFSDPPDGERSIVLGGEDCSIE